MLHTISVIPYSCKTLLSIVKDPLHSLNTNKGLACLVSLWRAWIGKNEKPRSLFELGQVVGTLGALAAMAEAQKDPVRVDVS